MPRRSIDYLFYFENDSSFQLELLLIDCIFIYKLLFFDENLSISVFKYYYSVDIFAGQTGEP